MNFDESDDYYDACYFKLLLFLLWINVHLNKFTSIFDVLPNAFWHQYDFIWHYKRHLHNKPGNFPDIFYAVPEMAARRQ